MPRNFVVLRRSPDWLNFDLELTRSFCSAAELPEDTILKFVARWDSGMSVGFLAYRHEMKELALRSARSVRNATLVTLADLGQAVFQDDDLIYFTDDDDWVSAGLFEALGREPPPEDGFIWRSVFVGKLFSDTSHEGVHSPAISERASSMVVYTNNYAVTGRAWKRLGAAALLEHFHTQQVVDRGEIVLTPVDQFLTAANKHPCCTVSIAHNDRSAWYVDHTREAIAAYVAALSSAPLSDNTRWIAPWLAGLIDLNRRALGQLPDV